MIKTLSSKRLFDFVQSSHNKSHKELNKAILRTTMLPGTPFDPRDEFISWDSPIFPQLIGENEIHIWRGVLDRDMTLMENPQGIMSNDEKIRAGKFHFEKDRNRYIVARGLQRIILSYYLDQEPSQLIFTYSQYGKPSLKTLSDEKIPKFNISHSGGLALFAITSNREVGIDIERITEGIPCEEIAERFFSPREKEDLLKIEPGKPRELAFFTTWTRKEAYIKARGEGLSMPLDQFDVSVAPYEPAKLIANRKDPEEVKRWTLMDLKTSPGFVSTLAAEGSDLRISYWEI